MIKFLKKDLRWTIWIIVTILLSIFWWIFFQSQLQIPITNNINKSNNVVNSWYIISNNVWQIAIWDNNKQIQNKLPTKLEENQNQQWHECESQLRAFYRRLSRNDIKWSYSMFDEYLMKSQYFSENRLQYFINNIVHLNSIEIQNLEKIYIDDSVYIARCEFNFKLKYIDKNKNNDVIELWKVTLIKDKSKYNIFKLWELKCIDLSCENNYLIKWNM